MTPNNDDMFFGLLLNKAKLSTNSNAPQNSLQSTNTEVVAERSLVVEKVADDNQILTLLNRIDVLEKRIQKIVLPCNTCIAKYCKVKKE
jgi:hypothetical protein